MCLTVDLAKCFEGARLPTCYALRRNSEARTRLRNCSGASVGLLVAPAAPGLGFTAAGSAAFAALRAASCASRLVAKSLACASTGSAGVPSRLMRWSWRRTRLTVSGHHFPMIKYAKRVGKRPPHSCGDLTASTDRERPNVFTLGGEGELPFFPKDRELLTSFFRAAISVYRVC
jgi:hypothetical protein